MSGGPLWPRDGRCGACGRPARQFPSERWEHVGVPCALRSRTMWSPSDDTPPCVFVPDGQPLPVPGGWRTRLIADPGQFPHALGINSPDARGSYWDAIRERLRIDAEAREVVS